MTQEKHKTTIAKEHIEQMAITALRTRLDKCYYLTYHIDSNDKTPSWDGEILIYKSIEDRKKTNLIGRVPIQLKGRRVDTVPTTPAYSIKRSDLQNYQNDGGVLFFVVYLLPNHKSAVYYNMLFSERAGELLASPTSDTKSINLSPFPDDKDQILSLIHHFYSNATPPLRLLNNLQVADLLISSRDKQDENPCRQFLISSYYSEHRGVLHHDACLYELQAGQLKRLSENDKKNLQGEASLAYRIKVGSQDYYDTCLITETYENISYKIGEMFELLLPKGTNKYILRKHQVSQSFVNYIHDLHFYMELCKTESFSINEIPVPTPGIAQQFNCNLSELQQHIEKCERLERLFKTLNINCRFNIYEISDQDCWFANYLCRAILDNELLPTWGPKLPTIISIAFMGQKILLSAIPQSDDGLYRIANLFTTPNARASYIDAEGKRRPATIFSVMRKSDFANAANLKLTDVLPSLQQFPATEIVDVANDIILKLLGAFDEAQDSTRQNELLQTAENIADWLLQNLSDVSQRAFVFLNRLQTLKRKNVQFTLDEQKFLIDILENVIPDNTVAQDALIRRELRFAAYLLLDVQAGAQYHWNTFDEDTQAFLRNYPIYRFFKLDDHSSVHAIPQETVPTPPAEPSA